MPVVKEHFLVDPIEIPKAQCLEIAYQAWKEAEGALSIRTAARQYGVAFSTLQKRTKGVLPMKQSSE